jgi:ubiquinone biosynthesis protein
MPEERLIERIVGQLKLRQIDDPGKRTLALIESTPSLQKLGQILARYPAVPPEMQHYLQQLENSIRTLGRDDLVEFIVDDLGDAVMEEYSIEFSDTILAEATIGAVIQASFQEPGHETRQLAVCKVVKPSAVRALTEELEILDGIVKYFEANGHTYDIGDVPLTQMFQDARNALEQEVQVVEEQSNLARAYEYYRDNPEVEVPEVYDFSTENVTFMEFITGGKITDAFPEDKASRARLAKSLGQILTIDVIFSPREKAIFHGDPHAGNVFSINDPDHPYKIGLLDWGLCGELDKEQREKLIQLILGLKLGNTKRIANNVDALLNEPIPDTPENAQFRQTLARKSIEVSNEKLDYFQVLAGLVADLAREGFVLDFNVALFIKAQVTITGILQELDPTYNRSEELFAWVRGEVYAEAPKRLLYTVYFPKWTSHDYRTMLSNEDVKDVQIKSIGRGFAKFGRGFWAVVSWPFRQPEPAGTP